MPRKPKTVREELAEERAKAARSFRKGKVTTIGEALEAGALKPATDVLTTLEPATPESIEAARQEARHEESPPPAERPIPPHDLNGKPEAPFEGGRDGNWQERVKRPQFAQVPSNFVNVDRYEAAGIRVNKSLDRSTVGIQFAEGDHIPDRQEKDLLEDKGINYSPATRQWQRTDRENPGANILDAKEVARSLAHSREDVERVFGR